MTAQAESHTPSISRRTLVALTLAAGAVVAVTANTVVALTAHNAGASSSFAPLMIAVYGSLTVVGLVVGYIGWRIVSGRVTRPVAVLRVLVPVLLVLSLVPDTITAVVGFIPNGSITGYVALMIMHPIVVAVGVPIYQRLAPVR